MWLYRITTYLNHFITPLKNFELEIKSSHSPDTWKKGNIIHKLIKHNRLIYQYLGKFN